MPRFPGVNGPVSRVEVRRAKARILAAKYRRKLQIKGSARRLTVRVTDGAGNRSAWKKAGIVRTR